MIWLSMQKIPKNLYPPKNKQTKNPTTANNKKNLHRLSKSSKVALYELSMQKNQLYIYISNKHVNTKIIKHNTLITTQGEK